MALQNIAGRELSESDIEKLQGAGDVDHLLIRAARSKRQEVALGE